MKPYITDFELKKIKKFLDIKGKRILLYHNDADGVCSAALWLKWFSGFEPIPKKGPRMETKFINQLADKKPDLIVFLDLPIDQEWKKIKKLKTKLIIIDHHTLEKNLNSKNIIHINPILRLSHVYIPVSCLIYRILEKMGVDVKEWVWIAGMGVIGDYGFECKDILNECKKIYPKLCPVIYTPKEWFDSGLGLGAKLISSATTLKGPKGAGMVLKGLIESHDYEEFIEKKELSEWKVRIGQELKAVFKESKKERYKNIMIYHIKTPLNITSMISTYIAEKYPDNIVVIKKKSGNEWKISVRGQKTRIDLGKLVKMCVKGIGSGGGHKKAAAALINNWKIFKERFLKKCVS
jgi:single-stranded DNA-specific DHH superfamily exonuclease